MPEVTSRVVFPTREVEFDIALDPDEVNANYILQHLQQGYCYEAEVAHVMLRVVKDGDFCIDVGAHLGFFTLLLAKLVGTGAMLAFEPGTNNLPRLKHNLEINGLSNVVLLEQPAWSRRETLRFHLGADSSGSNALWDPGLWRENELSRANPQSYEIEAVPIDDCTSRDVKLIKIDVEGAEQRVLEGAEILLASFSPPFIVAEIGVFGLREMGCSQQSLRDFMRQYGYEMFLINGSGILPTLIPRTTELDTGEVVTNVMFSTLERVSEYWPKVP